MLSFVSSTVDLIYSVCTDIFVPVPSQDKLGGLSGRASGVKMMGMAETGHQLVWMGWQSIWIVGASACVIFICTRKSRRWQNVPSGTSSPGLSWTKSKEL